MTWATFVCRFTAPPAVTDREPAPFCAVTEVEPAADCPDSAFVEDAVVAYRDLAVMTRPGAAERRPEVEGAEKSIRDAGYRVVHIEAPGTLDGGDVLKIGSTVYVGQGGRTNDEAIRQLREHLAPLGSAGVTLGSAGGPGPVA